MKSWDPHWQALLETHDQGQSPQKGGLLYAKYGKGIYVYNAYAFYRQLPEGVPGAYRIFANMHQPAQEPAALIRLRTAPLSLYGVLERLHRARSPGDLLG